MKNEILVGAFLIFPVLVFGAMENQRNIIDTSADGKSNVSELKGEFPSMKREEYNYEKEILLNYYINRKKVTFANTIGTNGNFVVEKTQEDQEDVDSQDVVKDFLNVVGYCIEDKTVDVGKQPMSASLECNTNIGAIRFFGNYVPQNQLETLFVTGLHIEKNGKKYKIDRAKVLNEDRSSYNVATYVNNRKLEKVALESTSRGATTVENGANDYLDALEASKKVEEASNGSGGIDNSGSGTVVTNPVVTRNTLPPEAKDYVIKGAVEIVAETIKAVADIHKNDLPYLYQVVKGSRYYIDLYVEKKVMGTDNTIQNNVNKENYTTTTNKKGV